MGTSNSRRAPTTRLWRLAKGAATRYLSPESAGLVEAREVAARYLAALGEGSGPEMTKVLGGFRLTRKVAQNLGAFCCQLDSGGWPEAVSAWRLAALPEEPSARAQTLGTALGAAGGGLEQAVVHTALVEVWQDLPVSGTGPRPAAAAMVRRFLAAAFHRRLSLDLGESLEAAAAGFNSLRQGLMEIGVLVDHAAEAAQAEGAAPLSAQQWLGLPGWTWVTQILAGLLAQLGDRGHGKILGI